MSWGFVAEVAGALLLLLGALLCLAAATGLIRFPDVLTRMHAATKPQTLGLLCAAGGLALSLREPRALGVLFLVAALQLLTAPVSAHMVGRTAYRTNQLRHDLLSTDDLADDLSRAGFTLVDGQAESDPRADEDDSSEDDPGDDSVDDSADDDSVDGEVLPGPEATR